MDHREEVRARITDLTSCLLVLDYKIEYYGSVVAEEPAGTARKAETP